MLLEKGLFQRQDLRKNSASVFSSQVSVLGAGLGLGGTGYGKSASVLCFFAKLGGIGEEFVPRSLDISYYSELLWKNTYGC